MTVALQGTCRAPGTHAAATAQHDARLPGPVQLRLLQLLDTDAQRRGKRRDRCLGSAAQVNHDIRRIHLGGRDEGERRAFRLTRAWCSRSAATACGPSGMVRTAFCVFGGWNRPS